AERIRDHGLGVLARGIDPHRGQTLRRIVDQRTHRARRRLLLLLSVYRRHSPPILPLLTALELLRMRWYRLSAQVAGCSASRDSSADGRPMPPWRCTTIAIQSAPTAIIARDSSCAAVSPNESRVFRRRNSTRKRSVPAYIR